MKGTSRKEGVRKEEERCPRSGKAEHCSSIVHGNLQEGAGGAAVV